MNTADTIAATSTASTAAMRAIIRVSGPEALAIAQTWTADLPHRVATPASIDVGLATPIPATVIAYHAPRSVTGDDLIEINLPGSPFVVSRLLQTFFARGIRQAEPGEFTARAFFNGKIDLAAAEGVVATIGASNRSELDAARGLLAGELSRRLTPIFESLIDVLARVEADVDFSDEDISPLEAMQRADAIDALRARVQRLLDEAPRLERFAHEPRIVLAGRPNAGKSTLLNALAGVERAVVSPTVGTTRDAVSTRVALRSGYVTLVDVAGLEELCSDEAQDIELQMQRGAQREIERADAIVFVRDSTRPLETLDVSLAPSLVVWTKVDLLDRPIDPTAQRSACAEVWLSARTGGGLDELRAALNEVAFPSRASAGEGASSLALNTRHVGELQAAVACLLAAKDVAGLELVAAEVRRAVDHVGRVLGSVSPDDVLGRIFSSFCIGK